MGQVRMNLLDHAHRCAYQSGDIPTRRAHTVHQLAVLLTRRLPVTLEALRLEFAELDGYSSTASGADRGGRAKGGVSRPVEACVLARDRDGYGIGPDHADLTEHVLTASDTVNRAWKAFPPPVADPWLNVVSRLPAQHATFLDDVDDWLNVATIALRCAHRICDRHNKPTDPNAPRALRCIGTGDASGATCEQISDYRVGDNGVVLPSSDGRCIDCRVAVERAEMEAARIKDATRKRTSRRLRRT